MDVLGQNLKQTLTHPDWTWLSLALYLATPIIWWRVAGDEIGLYHAATGPVSALILSGGVIAFLGSRTTWQKALSLQVGLIFAPSTFGILSTIFHSAALDWMRGAPLSPLTAMGIYVAFGLPWVGSMFAPAVIAAPFQWLFAPTRRTPSPTDGRAAPIQDVPAVRTTWLLWTAATVVGLGAPALFFAGAAIFYPVGLLGYTLLPAVLQWWVWRRHWSEPGWWIAATTAGVLSGILFGVSYILQDLYIGVRGELDTVLTWSAFGAVLGIAQWLVLRRRFDHAYVWVLANVLSWPAGWVIARLIGLALNIGDVDWADPVVRPAVVGAATGLALVWLLRRPRPWP